jgi:formylglycine-generating enzyme required for sulfatase activity
MTAPSAAIRALVDEPDDVRRLGPYRCVGLLGHGGFAPVFRAVEEHAGVTLRDVAVKVFDIGRTGPAWQARVIEEARALCRVEHANVVRFHALYTDEARGLMGLVMELVDGEPLDRRVDAMPGGDPRRIQVAFEMGSAVASALAAAHAAGLVHRDVKPANVVFANGTYKLIDFGIASLDRPSTPRDAPRTVVLDGIPLEAIGTKASFVAQLAGSSAEEPISGTFGYIDPVCLSSTAPASTASDLYALGATMFECLVGVVPAVAAARSRGESGFDTRVLLGEVRPPLVLVLVPGAPPALGRLVDALLSPSRADRPASAQAVVDALAALGSRMAQDGIAAPAGSDHELLESVGAGGRGPFARVAWIVGALAVLAGVALLGRKLQADRAARNPEMVPIPGASLLVGDSDGDGYEDEKPAHRVTLAPFRIDLTEVTVTAYGACVEDQKCSTPRPGDACTWGRPTMGQHPINCVDYYQAEAYCAWAHKRLPTEEEWELAARGTDGRRYPWGNQPPDVAFANLADESFGHWAKKQGAVVATMYERSDRWPLTAPVGSFPEGKTAFGGLDMAGNVAEWTSSAYCPYSKPGCDDKSKVVRGGCFANANADNVRASARQAQDPHRESNGVGFRCARDGL